MSSDHAEKSGYRPSILRQSIWEVTPTREITLNRRKLFRQYSEDLINHRGQIGRDNASLSTSRYTSEDLHRLTVPSRFQRDSTPVRTSRSLQREVTQKRQTSVDSAISRIQRKLSEELCHVSSQGGKNLNVNQKQNAGDTYSISHIQHSGELTNKQLGGSYDDVSEELRLKQLPNVGSLPLPIPHSYSREITPALVQHAHSVGQQREATASPRRQKGKKYRVTFEVHTYKFF
ncbi:hypothetical protein DPMN_045860 [Dreissena polymorpha]|uniref:Uncharacterized protein n=1 Tax=Dreissena polymorpha TaxID=45954 RepID=A0A9D4D546_DREPO|nr:hypothetical protein DPMN_045860 [Dreissena polymorpha]